MPMGAKSPCESLNTNKAMDGNIASQKQMEANLDVVVQMALFDPFEIRMQQGAHAEGASTLRSIQYFEEANLKVKIARYVFECCQRKWLQCMSNLMM
jgi:hypothetical protein